MKQLFFLVLLASSGALWAQNHSDHSDHIISGRVMDANNAPIIGANIYWISDIQNGTASDVDGRFSIHQHHGNERLVISYIGYANDTVLPSGKKSLNIVLQSNAMLQTTEVVHRKDATSISLIDPIKTEQLNTKELQKAACCNLSESFETTPSIDVSYTDAVTGTRQIQMLGLSGPYAQITSENIPDIRGLSAVYGLTFIPGSWIESVQLSKGTGSVVNGYESIAGQINVELKKPQSREKLFVNGYVNEENRLELNVNFQNTVREAKWYTSTLLHGSAHPTQHDRNKDNFLDMPMGNTLIAANRWRYYAKKGYRGQFGVKYTNIGKEAGQLRETPNAWTTNIGIQRGEIWNKLGRVFEDISWKSWGWQTSLVLHEQNSVFGQRNYDAQQMSVYSNFIYQSILSNTNHQFKTGASVQADRYEEQVNNQTIPFNEITPGAFFEYSNLANEDIDLVLGLRADYSSQYGAFFTPRAHFRYNMTEQSSLRLSAGRGQRTANIISENMGYLASNRSFTFGGEEAMNRSDLLPEVAYNFGLNFTQRVQLWEREMQFTFDAYRTQFVNQVVVDLDQNHQTVAFYNLDGVSRSNSMQAQVDYEVLPRFDVRIAYRLFDVQTTYNGELREKPFVAKHRAFINFGYEAPRMWWVDATVNWQGAKRIPGHAGNNYQGDYSPDYVTINGQVTKKWERFALYIGVENATNFKQKNPIIMVDNPEDPDFDASQIWGNIFGRNIYAGFRFALPSK